MNFKPFKEKNGFTIVELIVAIAIFTIFMVISMGSIMSVIDANRKSQSLRSVMDNLNFTLEAMTRNIRFGTNYHCDITQGIVTAPRNCSSGASSMAVTTSGGTSVSYKLVNGRIARSINGGSDFYLTSPDVTIATTTFYVFGSDLYNSGTDLLQPRAIIVISGRVGTKATSKSTFTIQTTVSQRQFDTQ